jgi:hypothetical protein
VLYHNMPSNALELIVVEKTPREWAASVVQGDMKTVVVRVSGCLTKQSAITQVISECIEKHTDRTYDIVELMYKYIEMDLTYTRIKDYEEQELEDLEQENDLEN